MIQEINPKLKNEYIYRKPKDNDVVMSFDGRNILLKYDKEIRYPKFGEYREIYKEELTYLFSIGNRGYYLANKKIELEGFSYEKMFEIRTMNPMSEVMAGATAYHLYTWYKANVYCGCCGEKLHHDSNMRMLKCDKCGNMVFPKIAPAVIVGVTNGDDILLTKYADREYKRYALVAGFTEIGETVEETVAREVFEETGIKVKNITYYKSQPWGFDSNLLMGFFCEADGNLNIKMDEEELAVAEWINYKDVPYDKEKLSLTREMMTYFKESRGSK